MSMSITQEITKSVSHLFPEDVIKIIQDYIEPELSLDSSLPECIVCYEELSSPQIVYAQCCFQRICKSCDQAFKYCVSCRSVLGDIRIQIGPHSMLTKDASRLRLLPGKNTVGSVIRTIKKFFPCIETQLASRLLMFKQDTSSNWAPLYN